VRRGFKAEAERISFAARTSLGLSASAKLDPWAYAEKLGAFVLGADELDLPVNDAAQLLHRDADSWSGMTLAEDGILMIVLNSSHDKRRQRSTLMHELSHSILDHAPATVQVSNSRLMLLSDYSDEQEEEADWLMGALLLPQVALLSHRGSGASIREIADLFEVSEDLCHWRCRMTGVEKRLTFHRRA